MGHGLGREDELVLVSDWVKPGSLPDQTGQQRVVPPSR